MPAPRDNDTGGPRRRAKARRRRSTPVSRARSQQRQYVSQGKAVRRAATQQRATPRNVAPVTSTHPKARHTPATRARAQQRQYVSQGRSVSKDAREQRALAKRRGHRARQRYFKGKPVEAFQRKIDRGERALGLLRMSDPESYDRRNKRTEASLGQILTGGPNVTLQSLFRQSHTAKGLGATAVNVARATEEDFPKVASTSLRVARESITGIPQGIKAIADHPIKAVDAIVKDYEERYGSVLDDPKKFRERVKSEWGLTPFVLDAAAAAGGLGQVAGGVAKTSRFGRAAAALERAGADPVTRAVGRAGGAVHRTVASERPALRFSAGREGVRPQARSQNLFVAAGQSRLDRSRAKALTKRTEGNRRRALDLEVRAGEVTPKVNGLVGRSLRDNAATRTFTGRIARDVGGAQSVSRLRLLTTQGRAISDMQHRISKLSRHERVAVREMAELGARADANGIAALKLRLSQIDPGSPDAEAIRTVLSDPEKFLTPKARKIVDELGDIQLEHALRDPRLPEATERLRRLAPQARLLGLERGPNPEAFLEKVAAIERETGTRGLTRLAQDVAQASPAERPALARKLARQIEVQANQARRDIVTADRRAAVAQAQVRATGRITTPEIGAARRELATATRERDRLKGELTGRRGEHVKVPGVRSGGDFRIGEATGGKRDLDVWQAVREGADDLLAISQKAKVTQKQASEIAYRLANDGRLSVGSGGRFSVDDAFNRPPPLTQATGLRKRIQDADLRVRQLREQVRQLEADAPVGTPAQRARARHHEIQTAARRQTRDHIERFETATRQVVQKAQSGARGFQPHQLEDYDKFAARVRTAADEAGLAEPAYWKGIIEGDLENAPRASNYAAGSGFRAGAKPKRSRGKLTEQGRGERDPDVLIRGVEANIKRRFQHELVARNIETHAFPWSKDGMTIDQIKFYAKDHGIDPDSIHIQDARITTRRNEDFDEGAEDLTSADPGIPTKYFGLQSASLRDITRRDYSDLAQNRYLALPAEVGETLNTAARALDLKVFRAAEIVLKQKPARLMLGALNVPWLAFQFASNAMLMGFGGGVNPFDIFGAKKLFDSMDPEARDAIEAELGITHGHHMNVEQTNLGASNNHMVAAWRGFKQTKTMRLAHRMNPLDAMFRADEAQNNFFRRTLFYSKARRTAYRRMGSNWKGIDRGITRLTDRVMGKPPDRMMQAIAMHGPEFERTAKHVKNLLGDYVSFTPAERFLLSRNVMFYGYLRFSLRFVFYTMPVAHPIMSAIMSDIGRMGSQEIKDLFGVPSSYALPPSMLAQTYLGDRRDAKRGTLRSINFGRMNPFLNTVTQMEDLSQAWGLVSPMAQALADQAYEESSFTGRTWQINGVPTPPENERTRSYFGSQLNLLNPAAYSIPGVTEGKPRNRILQRQLMGLAFPFRVAEDLKLSPTQSDDALPWSPRPMHYKDETAVAGINRARRKWEQEGAGKKLRAGLIPLYSKVTAAPQVVEREREKEADLANRARGKRKTRRRTSSNRGGAGTGSRGGSSTGSRGG